ncbi:transposase [Chlorogloea sp. CCALA 695]|uniref:transposase n=1 Tax=Chlorogloea sp. CCALA 695 TaxID=2107693 RepID=UPI0018EDFFBD|nr:transposase [Chlorogloea sp. CCALA 695]
MDAGYVDATLLLKSQKHYGVTIIGSMRPNASWQSKTSEAYDISQFQINWHTNGLRKARYQGLDKVQLQHILTATAINFVRMVAWLNDIPFAQTRISRFALLRLNN